MNKATIYDFARMCNNFNFNCSECPLHLSGRGMCLGCGEFIIDLTDEANEIILNWCKEHPVETRQDKFLKLFPNAEKLPNNVVNVSPCHVDKKLFVGLTTVDCIASKGYNCCAQCRKEYWLTEVEE